MTKFYILYIWQWGNLLDILKKCEQVSVFVVNEACNDRH